MTSMNAIWSGATTTDESTTQGDWSDPDNWQPISIVNSTYRWLAAGSDTGAYYLDLSGGGDPGISSPGNVQENGANMTSGTLGALASGEWAYGDDDTLGYSTIYVQLADDADPDSKAVDYVTFTQVPVATDDVTIPAGAKAISSGLPTTAVAYGDFTVEAGFTAGIASANEYLSIDPDSFTYAGGGNNAAFINLSSANIACTIKNTPQKSGNNQHGLYLLGSNLTTLELRAGNLAIAPLFNETATVATIDQIGGTLTVGSGVTYTTHNQRSGAATVNCAFTTANIDGGTFTSDGTGAITTINLEAGTANLNSSGTVTTINQNGGNVDMLQSGASRTVTTWNFYGGSRKYDPADVTVTNRSAPDGPVLEQVKRA